MDWPGAAFLRLRLSFWRKRKGVVPVQRMKAVSETDLANAVFGSTAKQDAVSYVGTAVLGYTTEVVEKVWFDARAFASIAHHDGDGFTDSAGIVVDYTKSDVRRFGLMTGLSAELGEGVSAFACGGVKWVNMDRQSSAFGFVIDGKAKTFVKSVEAGLSANLSDSATLSASAFGDFTKASTSYGGELALKFKF